MVTKFRSSQCAEPYDHKEDYFKDLLERIGTTLPLHVGVDCGNGTASLFAPQLLGRAGAQVEPLYCDSQFSSFTSQTQ